MRWPWRGRGRHAKGRVVFIGTSPFDIPAPVPIPVPTPSPVGEASVPVQLGFADGSVLDLPADDPRAVALRAVAASLARKH